ncbi:MAG: hypothetical protein PHAS_00574 [Phascolarctobacterium sp.]|uniref:TIM barrel protein n=1 Tax=uncultured Phascolarctobacterium sp. TaxID=512296 RepID=UPI0025D25BC1|nr:TIM barrel protein [uncultured Phascolarctobacterium sp.]
MKQLINYCPVHGYEQEINVYNGGMCQYLKDNDLDGVELYVYQQQPYAVDYTANSVGVHLKYWPYWLDFWYGDESNITKNYPDKNILQEYYYGAVDQDQWLKVIRNNIMAALAVKPEYLVWHVSNCDLNEIFTFNFRYDDKQVVDATIEVFNLVADCISDDVTVLFENLWWPGLRLVDPFIVERLLSRVKKKNVGIMLDTGHLMNTNPSLTNETEAVEFICKVTNDLGAYKDYIKGLHLSCSLSGAYQKQSLIIEKPQKSMAAIMHHITSIDQHRIFKNTGLNKLLTHVEPSYVVHELFYDNMAELSKLVKLQQKLLRK